ncbi:hypothetical protein D9V37_09300 [Nocardioides mangrovicus]|uniref:Peptidase M10 metallopeptidase domain-containing protein n=1 Tax=Nocardioides mangrovicus TaxID=2478913 RepID=A0A3L8P6I0_9ACTN|nr:matrixin family metalloprotease [Nocardioides mangrovicus]RLV50048.1 hypothetical protein D9V37_09300 [Nocardioides mangrovicus]
MLSPRVRALLLRLTAWWAPLLALVTVTAPPVAEAAPKTAAPIAPYAFEATQARGSYQAVGWNPCRAISVRVNLAHAPRHSLRVVQQALTQVAAATGIDIRYAGLSHHTPGFLRHYGVLVAWSTPARQRTLAGPIVGLGASRWRQPAGGSRHYVRGAVTLDGPALRHAGAARQLAVLEHELGHVMGLAHVGDRNQLMYPVIGRVSSYAAGDLAGLAALGSLPCS